MYTLLLADDSVTIQRVIELTFADEDVQVIAVSDGDQAVERLEAAPPDIVLADIGMPGRNGYEVARYVKQTPKLAHIPVVLLTGAFEPVDQARATEVGCDGVLSKPFEPQLVIARVKDLLERSSQSPAAPTLEPMREVTPEPPPRAELGSYFDRLDAAFAKRTKQPAPPAEDDDLPLTAAPPRAAPVDLPLSAVEPKPAAPPASAAAPPTSAAAPPASVAAPPASAAALPASVAAPPTPVVPPPTPVAAPPPPAAAPSSRELPSIADAFAVLLAAERGEPMPTARPAWPASRPAPAAPVLSEELIDEIARRVLDRISVSDIVTEVTERLVREEIERIKARSDNW